MPRNARQPVVEDGLIQMLLHEDHLSFDAKHDRLRSIRRMSEEAEAHVDQALLGEIGHLRAGLREAQALQQEIREAYEELDTAYRRLSAPPLYPATFLEYRTIGERKTALVCYDNSRRFVNIADEFDSAAVKTGDQILLSGDLNVIVDQVACTLLDDGETAMFERYADGGRLVLSRRDEEVIASPSESLREGTLKKGDEVRWSPAAGIAFERIERSSGDHLFLEAIPKLTFADIGGLDAVVDALKNVVLLQLLHSDLASRYGVRPERAVLLVGPPGTGKTMLVRALVNWLSTLSPTGDAKFINIKPGELESMWYSQTEARIREVFSVAREAAAADPTLPVVMFFDEVDWIATARGGDIHRVDDRAVDALAVELEGLEDRGNILVVAATNRRDILDPALVRPGRLADKVIEVGRPNRCAARAILSKYFREDMPYVSDSASECGGRNGIVESALSRLYSPNGEGDVALLTFRDGTKRMIKIRDVLTGATIAKVAGDAARRACLREIETKERGIRMADVSAAIADEMESAGRMLTPANCFRHLTDLPHDADVVNVEPVRRKPANVLRYIRVA